MSDLFLIYNDVNGNFVDFNEVQSVEEHEAGSLITLKSGGKTVISPLNPREVARRLDIIRYKRETDGQSNSAIPRAIPQQPQFAVSVDQGCKLSTRK
jgi:hypothetical protein